METLRHQQTDETELAFFENTWSNSRTELPDHYRAKFIEEHSQEPVPGPCMRENEKTGALYPGTIPGQVGVWWRILHIATE